MAPETAPETFLRQAIELATERTARGRGGPFGALVVRAGQVVAAGWNAVVPLGDPTAHAEIQAIRAACTALGRVHLGDCDLYASCEPCPMCLGAIHWARLGRVYFAATREDAAAAGFDDARFHAEVGRAGAERAIPFVRLLPDEGRRPFAAWLSKPDREPY